MRQRNLILVIFCGTILLIPSFLRAQSNYKYVNMPDTDIYFGYISYTEVQHDGRDPVVLREGQREAEVAVLNFPLTAGDTIRTSESRRCEIQFDTGTILRLDVNTELKIETVLAQSLSSRMKITALTLTNGQIYIMYARYARQEMFQVMTPNAAVKLNNRAVALINTREDNGTDIQVKRGKVNVIYGPDKDKVYQKKLKKLEKATVSRDHQLLSQEYREDVDFELWNKNINENFEEMHKEKSFLPQPVQKLPKAVFYFAQKYSNMYGEWQWNSLYGYVWRPHLNDQRSPFGNWTPYIYGSWRAINGQLFWIPGETWGWVPYHLGLWMWDKKSGWIWIPGSAFAPAWVMWDFFMGYNTWRPWNFWDWYSPYGYNYFDIYPLASYSSWEPYYYLDRYRDSGDKFSETGKKKIYKIQKIQKKKINTTSYKMPKSLKKAYKNYVAALEKKDERVLGPIRKFPEQMVIVKGKDLNEPRIHQKRIEFKEVMRQMESSLSRKETVPHEYHRDPFEQAVRTYYRNKAVSFIEKELVFEKSTQLEKTAPFTKERVLRKKMKEDIKGEGFETKYTLPRSGTVFPGARKLLSTKPALSTVSPVMRFRDWNPDVKVASKLGVTIRYASRTNEISCPMLGLSSRNISVRNSLTRGGFYSSGGFSSGSVASSSSSSSSGGASTSAKGSSNSSGSSSGGRGKSK